MVPGVHALPYGRGMSRPRRPRTLTDGDIETTWTRPPPRYSTYRPHADRGDVNIQDISDASDYMDHDSGDGMDVDIFAPQLKVV